VAGIPPLSAADCGDTVTLRSEPSACPSGWGLVPSHQMRHPQKSIMAKFDSWQATHACDGFWPKAPRPIATLQGSANELDDTPINLIEHPCVRGRDLKVIKAHGVL
jgi:hypothetical protein